MADTSYNIVVQAENKVNAGLTSAEQHLKAFDQRMQKMRDKDGGGGALEGPLGKFAIGGAALASMEQIGSKLAQWSGKVAELNNQYNEGKITVGQMVDEQARAVPILGNVVTAAGNVLEIFTGWKAESAAMVAQAEATNRVFEGRLALQKLSVQYHEQAVEKLRAIHQQEELLLASGNDRAKLAQQQATRGAITGIDADARTKIENVREHAKQQRAGTTSETDRAAITEDEENKINKIRADADRLRMETARVGLMQLGELSEESAVLTRTARPTSRSSTRR